MTLFVLSLIACVGAGAVAALAVQLKRSAVRGWRRWLVSLELERCDLEHEAHVCTRTIEW